MEDSTSQGDQMTDNNIPAAEEVSDDTTVPSVPSVPNEDAQEADTPDEPDTFPRAYVEELRQENGKYRQRAQQADELAHRLHRALVEQTGRLQDPTDLPFDDDHLTDTGKLVAAIDELLAAKPHLAARRVTGDVGQGASSTAGVDLAAIMRSHT